MTGKERDELRELTVNLFGDDGTGGAVNAIRRDVTTLRSDMDKIKGALTVISFLLALVGFDYIVSALGERSTLLSSVLSAVLST
ncbi:MAG: hypothetical protein IT345_10600 [Trueperaceae bacterium]|nr:hypothetical protein [Trueperaceae bacterium]